MQLFFQMYKFIYSLIQVHLFTILAIFISKISSLKINFTWLRYSLSSF
ncbi:unnamed protein product [Brassica oleracea var. botrytis]|uniref:(rape) hypothetical protein n=1 Tax=Brassica napus TaxID=3708 RepID=A0A816USR9_BRANA|nr:unnamed protein product [Brassica napus]